MIQAKQTPVDLSSFDPPPARRFAIRQLELMEQQGMSRHQAQGAVEKEMAEETRCAM